MTPITVPASLPGARIVNPRTGIIRRLERRPVPDHLPRSFGLVTAILADTTQFSPWAADASAAGYGFADDTHRCSAAIAEAAERYCGYLVPPGLTTTTFDDLAGRGIDALDPDDLALYSDRQHQDRTFPFAPFTRSTPTAWTIGTDLTTGEETLVPAALAWVTYFDTPGASHLARTNPIIQAGLAAGPAPTWAHTSGLYEVIERDAMTLCWHGRLGLRQLKPPAWLAGIAAGPTRALTTRFYDFPNDYGLPVIGALILDRQTGYLSLGMGATTTPTAAATKALAESIQLQLLLARYDDPDGAFAAAAAEPASPLKPWRADRSYSRAYRADLADVVDYGCHLQLHLDPEIQRRFEHELAEAVTDLLPLDALATTTFDDVVSSTQRHGQRVLAADLTTDDVRRAGLHVTRVLVPGCYSNGAAGLPFLGGHRLSSCLSERGAERRALPLPH